MGKPKTRADHAAARERKEEKRARKAEAMQKDAQQVPFESSVHGCFDQWDIDIDGYRSDLIISDSIRRQYYDAEKAYIKMNEQVEK
ncbi:hypothetical protein Pmar_PMAR016429 [Perkinsus marinus ATCC 50983]|nr:hypothetical protein Pmar_PMAR016429 [Perkinsus marinus ATCC 50983]EER09498.1 hypothetical protein Pmar_PMAR016429 [Perkinsus marinus ATCC 50983]|eukprot:XP_002777682.1 hypothetical protein Pmar_PMAR016429 [Perkinsus marinus ATCC 50983]